MAGAAYRRTMTRQVLDPVHPDGARPSWLAPLTGRVGAEVRGVHLCPDLDEQTHERLHVALLRHKVLFFRAQHHLDAAGLEAFARLLGDTAVHPELDDWHTDASFSLYPPRFGIAHATEAPARGDGPPPDTARSGGETEWADTAAAYDGLPVELRELADRLWVVHTGPAETEHPLVRVHPETRERALLLGGFGWRVAGLSEEADSAALLRLFQDHVTRPENTVRWRWSPGDVALWDNRATQHRAVAGPGGRPRHSRHLAIGGETPIAVDGRRSVPR